MEDLCSFQLPRFPHLRLHWAEDNGRNVEEKTRSRKTIRHVKYTLYTKSEGNLLKVRKWHQLIINAEMEGVSGKAAPFVSSCKSQDNTTSL